MGTLVPGHPVFVTKFQVSQEMRSSLADLHPVPPGVNPDLEEERRGQYFEKVRQDRTGQDRTALR